MSIMILVKEKTKLSCTDMNLKEALTCSFLSLLIKKSTEVARTSANLLRVSAGGF